MRRRRNEPPPQSAPSSINFALQLRDPELFVVKKNIDPILHFLDEEQKIEKPKFVVAASKRLAELVQSGQFSPSVVGSILFFCKEVSEQVNPTVRERVLGYNIHTYTLSAVCDVLPAAGLGLELISWSLLLALHLGQINVLLALAERASFAIGQSVSRDTLPRWIDETLFALYRVLFALLRLSSETEPRPVSPVPFPDSTDSSITSLLALLPRTMERSREIIPHLQRILMFIITLSRARSGTIHRSALAHLHKLGCTCGGAFSSVSSNESQVCEPLPRLAFIPEDAMAAMFELLQMHPLSRNSPVAPVKDLGADSSQPSPPPAVSSRATKPVLFSPEVYAELAQRVMSQVMEDRELLAKEPALRALVQQKPVNIFRSSASTTAPRDIRDVVVQLVSKWKTAKWGSDDERKYATELESIYAQLSLDEQQMVREDCLNTDKIKRQAIPFERGVSVGSTSVISDLVLATNRLVSSGSQSASKAFSLAAFSHPLHTIQHLISTAAENAGTRPAIAEVLQTVLSDVCCLKSASSASSLLLTVSMSTMSKVVISSTSSQSASTLTQSLCSPQFLGTLISSDEIVLKWAIPALASSSLDSISIGLSIIETHYSLTSPKICLQAAAALCRIVSLRFTLLTSTVATLACQLLHRMSKRAASAERADVTWFLEKIATSSKWWTKLYLAPLYAADGLGVPLPADLYALFGETDVPLEDDSATSMAWKVLLLLSTSPQRVTTAVEVLSSSFAMSHCSKPNSVCKCDDIAANFLTCPRLCARSLTTALSVYLPHITAHEARVLGGTTLPSLMQLLGCAPLQPCAAHKSLLLQSSAAAVCTIVRSAMMHEHHKEVASKVCGLCRDDDNPCPGHSDRSAISNALACLRAARMTASSVAELACIISVAQCCADAVGSQESLTDRCRVLILDCAKEISLKIQLAASTAGSEGSVESGSMSEGGVENIDNIPRCTVCAAVVYTRMERRRRRAVRSNAS